MDEKKQIEEMAKVVEEANEFTIEGVTNAFIKCKIVGIKLAAKLYNAGYRRQKQGEWVKATPYSQEYCNQCGLTPKTIFGKLPPYCPNCGAKMKGGAE